MEDLAHLILQARRAALLTAASHEEQEDLVQETLIRVWQRQVERGGSRPSAGLIRTALRRVRIDWWRKRRPREDGRAEARSADGSAPLEQATRNELRGQIRRAVASLPQAQREVVHMRYFEDKSFREIAALQGVSLNTALGRMHLAAKKLRRALEDGE